MIMLKIAIASDHAGVDTKSQVINFISKLGYECNDLGPNSPESVDYPDYAFKVAEAVSSGKYQRGILICGTGLGMCIAAGKVKGIRAVTPYDEFTAEISRKHNDANVLCLGARSLKTDKMMQIVKIWLGTEFESGDNASRHLKRLKKISDYESKK